MDRLGLPGHPAQRHSLQAPHAELGCVPADREHQVHARHPQLRGDQVRRWVPENAEQVQAQGPQRPGVPGRLCAADGAVLWRELAGFLGRPTQAAHVRLLQHQRAPGPVPAGGEEARGGPPARRPAGVGAETELEVARSGAPPLEAAELARGSREPGRGGRQRGVGPVRRRHPIAAVGPGGKGRRWPGQGGRDGLGPAGGRGEPGCWPGARRGSTRRASGPAGPGGGLGSRATDTCLASLDWRRLAWRALPEPLPGCAPVFLIFPSVALGH
mmetsp:Transcript_92787/g.241715  ORF Transcript_92787/g.241715 Transcript_92787/m.241715 type:complete len:271 (-) Transcript_92787:57-869(-)